MEIKKELKQIINSNTIFFIGVILLIYKGVLLNIALHISIKPVALIYMAAVTFLLMCPTINNRKKFSYIYLNILYLIITILIYANYLYYRYSTNFISLYQIENMKYAKEIADGLSCLINFKNIMIFWLDNLALLFLSIFFYKKLEKIKYDNKILKVTFIFIIIFVNIFIVKKEIHNIYISKSYNKTLTVQDISIYYYQYEDAKNYILGQFIKEKIDYEKLENAYQENLNDKVAQTQYTGIAKNSNVIILQLESLNEYIIDKKVNGKEITPNLNRFFKNNIYCNNMYNQGLGTTADSEFEMSTSMYPLENGYVFQKYYGNNWRDIYSTLKYEGYHTSFMHPNVSTFWNRDAVYHTGFNIDEYNDITAFSGIENAGEFHSDEGFFEKSIEIMNSYEGNFCTTLVSVTTHIPFELDGVSNLQEKLTLTYEDVEQYENWVFRNYLISCNFVDYAFGQLLENLEKTGLLDNSIFVVYGDHGAGIASESDIEKLYNDNNLAFTEFEKNTLDVHIPFGIKIPTVSENKVIENAVSKIDIKPTILDLLDVKDNFSLGNTIFSDKDYSFIKGLGFVTSNYYCIADKYYDKATFEQMNETESLENLSLKMKNEIYLSDTIIKNNLIYDKK